MMITHLAEPPHPSGKMMINLRSQPAGRGALRGTEGMTDLPHDLITPVEAAQLAEVSLPTLTRATATGEITNYRLASGTKATFYSKALVRRWRDQRRTRRQTLRSLAAGAAAS